MSMVKILSLCFVLTNFVPGAGAMICRANNWSVGFAGGQTIPASDEGWVDARTVSARPNPGDGWSGVPDLRLINSSGGSAAFRNWSRASEGNDYGYDETGFDFAQTTSDDPIHDGQYYAPGFIGSGLRQGTSQASGDMTNFIGQNLGGMRSWFIADSIPGGVTTVGGLGLWMETVPAPVVESWMAAALAGAFGAFWVNRQVMEGVPERPAPNL